MNRASAAVVASTVGVLLLSGCAGDPSTAAVVDGRTITRDEVDAAVEDLAAGNGEGAGQVVWALAVAPLYIEAAEAEGFGISAQEARTALGDPQQAGGADGVIADSTVEIARYFISANTLESEGAGEVLQDVADQVAALEIDVNPRYGDVDLAAETVREGAVPWLVGLDGAGAEG